MLKKPHRKVRDFYTGGVSMSNTMEYKGYIGGAELHKQAAVYALSHQLSLNRFIAEAVHDKLVLLNQ